MTTKRKLEEESAAVPSYDAGKKPKSDFKNDIRPGDWYCPSCTLHNFATRYACRACGTMKQQRDVIKTPAEGEAAGEEAPKADEKKFGNPNDWSCPNCGDHVYASRPACRKCGTARGSTPGLGSAAKGGPNDIRPGDWNCPTCQLHNFATRHACRKCGTPKQAAQADSMNMWGMHDQQMAMGGGGMMQGAAYGNAAYGNAQYGNATQYGAHPNMMPGDWVCECGQICMGHCNACMCGKLKPEVASAGGGWGGVGEYAGGPGYGAAAEADQYYAMGPSGVGGGPGAGVGHGGVGPEPYYAGGGGAVEPATSGMRPGDWNCPRCGEHVYAGRPCCRRCGYGEDGEANAAFPSPGPPDLRITYGGRLGARPDGGRPGDWYCPNCNDHCYATRRECRKCGTPKPL